MPYLVEGSQKAGILRGDLAKKWGVKEDVVVAGGAGDNAAAACGMGSLNEGEGFISLGTSGVLLAARDGYRPAPETALHTFCHAVPNRWYQMGVMLSATNSLNWFARITGTKPAELTNRLGETLRAPGKSVRFLPYLSGERTPHNDAEIRGSFIGLSTHADREDLTRAILEGVAFGLRDSYEALRGTGARFEQLFAIGGGAASGYWLKTIATVLDVPLVNPGGGEFGAALGAARLGISAAIGASPQTIMQTPDVKREILPEAQHKAAFDDAYKAFCEAYPAIKSDQ
jgi:xylulokinase